METASAGPAGESSDSWATGRGRGGDGRDTAGALGRLPAPCARTSALRTMWPNFRARNPASGFSPTVTGVQTHRGLNLAPEQRCPWGSPSSSLGRPEQTRPAGHSAPPAATPACSPNLRPPGLARGGTVRGGPTGNLETQQSLLNVLVTCLASLRRGRHTSLCESEAHMRQLGSRKRGNDDERFSGHLVSPANTTTRERRKQISSLGRGLSAFTVLTCLGPQGTQAAVATRIAGRDPPVRAFSPPPALGSRDPQVPSLLPLGWPFLCLDATVKEIIEHFSFSGLFH